MRGISTAIVLTMWLAIPLAALLYMASTTPNVKAGIKCMVDVSQCRR